MRSLAVALVVLIGTVVASAYSGLPSLRDQQRGAPLPAHALAITISSFVASPNSVYVGEEVTFFANASSTVGSSLTFRIFYDGMKLPWTNNTASPTSINVTGNPGSIVQKFTYNRVGNFSGAQGNYSVAKLFVGDGASTVSTQIVVWVNERPPNRAPRFSYQLPPQLGDVEVNVPVNLTVGVSDPDDDPLTVLWDFGDGTTATNVTGGALAGIYVNQTHAWSPYVESGQGDYYVDYWLNVTVEDPFGNSNRSTTLVRVYVPPNLSPTVRLTTSVSIADPTDEIFFYANATDPEGDPLTWTFDFGDGTVEVYHTDPTVRNKTVWNNRSHVYGVVGNYTVILYVSDALIPHQVDMHNITVGTSIRILVNQMPFVTTTISASMGSPYLNTSIGYVVVAFSIEANDPDGDVLRAVWSFSDDPVQMSNVSAGGADPYRFVQVRTIYEAGLYNVTVVVTDGREGHEVVRHLSLLVGSDNRPPNLALFHFDYGGNETGRPGQLIQFTLVIDDPEGDPVEVTWDFGDGSPRLYFNLSDYVDGNVTCVVSHSFPRAGVFNLTIWFTDNKIGVLDHLIFLNATVTVTVPLVVEPSVWDWFDYTCLSLLALMPALAIARLLYIGRKRRELERKGLSLEETELKKEEQIIRQLLKEGGKEGG